MKFARWVLLIAIIMCCLFTAQPTIHAQLPYWTVTTDAENRWMQSQAAYLPEVILDGFESPEDLFITAKDEIYVAESGADRIKQVDIRGVIVRTLPLEAELEGKGALNTPEGVYVTEEGEVYVADTGNRRIAIFSADGHYSREIKQPATEFLPKNYVFIPSKIVVDQRGYLYIGNKGGYQGLLLLTPEGEFTSFYGANKVPKNFVDSLKRKFYTDEQLQEEDRKLPGAVTNMFIDKEGFIYTVNRDLEKGQLKRLNSGGVDLLGNRDFAPWASRLFKQSFLDVFVNSTGMMTVMSEDGRIFQYDVNGKMIFRFGNSDMMSQRFGLFRNPSSLIMDSKDHIYVADRELNMIQVFKTSEFGSIVHKALALYSDGKYLEAVPFWKRIIELNGNFDKAAQGEAKANYKEADYVEAMGQFLIAHDKLGYSDSYWQVRMNSLTDYFGPVMSVILLLILAWAIWKRVRRKKEVKVQEIIASKEPNDWLISLRYVWKVIKHPIEGMYDLANDKAVRWPFALLLILLSFTVYIIGKYQVSFLFETIRVKEMSLLFESLKFFLPLATWIIGSYLIGSVMKGEASFKKVFIINAYAMIPLILLLLPIQWLSNVLTLQEGVIYYALFNFIYIWIAILMFSGIVNAQNYNIKEAIGMTTVSLLTVACIWLFGFILIIVLYQAYDFIYQVGREWRSNV